MKISTFKMYIFTFICDLAFFPTCGNNTETGLQYCGILHITYYLLLIELLHIIYYLLFIDYYALLIVYYLLNMTYYLLLMTHYILLIVLLLH